MINTKILRCVVAALLLWNSCAFGQGGAVLQGGPWVEGHVPVYVGPGSGQAVVQDGGNAGGGGTGTGISELGLIARGAGTPPYVGQGTGPDGENFCDFDAPLTNPTGYHFLCLSPNATVAGQTGGQIVYGAGGAAAALPLYIVVNGTSVTPGGSIGAITVGSTLVNAGSSNCVLYDFGGVLQCSTTLPTGTAAATAAFGTNTTQIATTGFVDAAFAGMTGDCTATILSVITCKDTNGTPFGTMATQNASAVTITGGSITGLPAPVNPSDAATKSYVDASTAGLTILASSTLATATALPNSPTYSNGSSGVGATLTAGSNTTLTVDGAAAPLNTVVLVNNQASAFQNGIYTVTTAGSGSAAWVLTRATYFNQSSNMLKGSYTFITSGVANINTSWVLAATATTVGTTAVSFNQFSAAGVGAVCGLTGAPTAAQLTACLNQFSSSLQGLVPASGGGTSTFLRADGAFAAPPGASIDNLLPNNQWQMTTGNVLNIKQNATGTGNQSPATCGSFQTSNAAPQFQCSNTGQIKVGDLVVVAAIASFSSGEYDKFWGFAGAGYISCNSGTAVSCTPAAGNVVGCAPANNSNGCYITASRVTAVVTNTSITIQGYMGGVSPTISSGTFLYPIARPNANLTIGPDGWSVTASVETWADDFASHAYPGAIRVLGMRGGATGTESATFNVPTNQLARFQGQVLSCGVAADQTIQGGSGTWNLTITDSAGTTSSASGTGTGAGGYQFEAVTRTISQSATSVSVSLNKLGNSGDVVYWALPTCGFVPAVVQSQLHQNSNEYIVATGHCNPPLLTPLIIQFSGAVGGLWGWLNLDLDAMSFDCYHNSLGGVMAKVEWTTATPQALLLVSTDIQLSSFSCQVYTQVANITNMGGPCLVRLTSQGYFMMVSATHNLSPVGTFDFWDGVAGMANPLH